MSCAQLSRQNCLNSHTTEDKLKACASLATLKMSSVTQDPKYEIAENRRGTFEYKGFRILASLSTPELMDSIEDFEIRDDDVFIVTYPKSGTVFSQQVMSLIYNEGYRNGAENTETLHQVPWIEYDFNMGDPKTRSSPRLFCTHLPYYLVPRGLTCKRGKIIYVLRNPKDVLTSFYYFEKMLPYLDPTTSFEDFMEKYLKGEVFGGCWFEHFRGWHMHKDNFDFLLISFEEMVKNLRSVVVKICQFTGKHLSDLEMDSVVKQAAFKNMRSDTRANYKHMPSNILDNRQGSFLRKGTIGDWKNVMTIAQNERFDKIYQEKMKDIPVKFIWDINEDE
ncbi:amine sulfotransferase-like isoform X1 [Lissotriton helveticus]